MQSSMITPKHLHILLAIFVLVLVSLACGFGAQTPEPEPATAVPAATDTPVSTNTEVPPTDVPTETPTPEPTATETPLPTDTPTATPDLAATAAAEETQAAEEMQSMIFPVLDSVGVSPDSGELAFVDPGPNTIFSNEYGTIVYAPMDDGAVYDNFVLSVDVVWESSGGLAGCGLIFRAEQNLDMGEQYQFFSLRLSGLPMWDVELWNFGQFQSVTTGEPKVNSAIKQENGATNHYVLVAKDDLLTAYVNDVRLSNVIVSKRSEGRFGYFTWQESGETTCTFENIWIFALDSE